MNTTPPLHPPTAPHPEYAGLVRRIAQGDQAALGALYDRTSAATYSRVLRILRDPTSAEEVTLDLYLHVWHHAATFDDRRGSVSAWLAVMARSRALDRLRARLRRGVSVEPLEHDPALRAPDDPEAAHLASDRQRQVRRALGGLPQPERHAIECAFFDGLSHGEVAAVLGVPLGTAKSRIRQGLLRLRRALDPSGLSGPRWDNACPGS